LLVDSRAAPGIFAGATGALHWSGTVQFTETGLTPHLVGVLFFT
jgi:hypothetical protein